MDRVRAPNDYRAGFGQAKESHFALCDQLSHRSDRLFDRRVGINPVLIIEVDAIDSETAQTSLAGFFHIIRFAVDAAECGPLRIADDSELRRDHNVFAMALQRAPDER